MRHFSGMRGILCARGWWWFGLVATSSPPSCLLFCLLTGGLDHYIYNESSLMIMMMMMIFLFTLRLRKIKIMVAIIADLSNSVLRTALFVSNCWSISDIFCFQLLTTFRYIFQFLTTFRYISISNPLSSLNSARQRRRARWGSQQTKDKNKRQKDKKEKKTKKDKNKRQKRQRQKTKPQAEKAGEVLIPNIRSCAPFQKTDNPEIAWIIWLVCLRPNKEKPCGKTTNKSQ